VKSNYLITGRTSVATVEVSLDARRPEESDVSGKHFEASSRKYLDLVAACTCLKKNLVFSSFS
jgi:hypothetical protein